MSSDILSILLKRVTDDVISEERKKQLAERMNNLEERHATTAGRMVISYYARFDKNKKIIGQQNNDIPYSGKQLEEGVKFHNKMLPDKLLLALEQLIQYIDSESH